MAHGDRMVLQAAVPVLYQAEGCLDSNLEAGKCIFDSHGRFL